MTIQRGSVPAGQIVGKVLAKHPSCGDRSLDELASDINQALLEAPPGEPKVS
jgi:hypothetical protein